MDAESPLARNTLRRVVFQHSAEWRGRHLNGTAALSPWLRGANYPRSTPRRKPPTLPGLQHRLNQTLSALAERLTLTKEGEDLPKKLVQYKLALCIDEHKLGEEDSGAATMKRQPCGAGYGIPFLSAGAGLLTAGMLVATAFPSAGQTRLN